MRNLPAPFVVHVLSDDPQNANAIAAALRPALDARRAVARIETATRPIPGTVAAVGVMTPEGTPSWIDPIAAEGDATSAANAVVAFLERWGFIGAQPRRA